MSDVERNRRIFSWLRDHSLVSEAALLQAWTHLRPGQDAFDALVAAGHLSPHDIPQLLARARGEPVGEPIGKPIGEPIGEPIGKPIGEPRENRSGARGEALVFEKYEVLGEISRGGMGRVLRARQRSTGNIVALKVILGAHPSPEESRRFQVEAEALASLRHRNILRVIDGGVDAGRPFLAMELIEGRPYKAVISESLSETGAGPGIPELVEVFTALASALEFCHERGILHRDVKPANVLIEDGTGRPVLIDFGLVKRGEQDQLTATGAALGTPEFMAPEQLDGKSPKIGPAADIWGWGATLFAAVSGRPPFQGASAFAVYKQILTRAAPRLRDIRPDAPEWLDELCARVLVAEPAERPSWAELREMLAEPERILARRSRRRLATFAALTGALALAFALGALAVAAWPKTPRLSIAYASKDASLGYGEIRGHAEHAAGGTLRLLVSGGEAVELPIGPDGAFEGRVPLPAAQSVTVEVQAISPQGMSSPLSRWQMEADTEAPLLSLTKLPVDVDGPTARVRGWVTNERRYTIVAGDQEFPEQREPDFEVELRLAPGRNTVTLRAVDAAGNSSDPISLTITRRPVFAVRLDDAKVPEALRPRLDGARRFDELGEALAAIAEPGTQVWLGEGTWVGHFALRRAGTRLIGMGRADHIILTAPAGADAEAPTLEIQDRGALVEGLSIRGHWDAIPPENPTDTIFEEGLPRLLEIRGEGVTLRDVELSRAPYVGLLVTAEREGSREGDPVTLRLVGCRFKDNLSIGLWARGAAIVEVEGGSWERCYQEAICLAGASRLAMGDSRLDSNARGVSLSDGSIAELAGIAISNSGRESITLEGRGTLARLRDCVIEGGGARLNENGNLHPGLRVMELARLEMSGGEVKGTAGMGLIAHDRATAQLEGVSFEGCRWPALCPMARSSVTAARCRFVGCGPEGQDSLRVLSVDAEVERRLSEQDRRDFPHTTLTLEACEVLRPGGPALLIGRGGRAVIVGAFAGEIIDEGGELIRR